MLYGSLMSQLTFRDFAGALMGGDAARASEILTELLGVERATADAATSHFGARMAEGPAFVQKAMSMRNAVESKDATALSGLIEACFGLSADVAKASAEAVLSRYV